jgi:hypothetical protein
MIKGNQILTKEKDQGPGQEIMNNLEDKLRKKKLKKKKVKIRVLVKNKRISLASQKRKRNHKSKTVLLNPHLHKKKMSIPRKINRKSICRMLIILILSKNK